MLLLGRGTRFQRESSPGAAVRPGDCSLRWRTRPFEVECYLAGRRHVLRRFSPEVFDLPFCARSLEPLDEEAIDRLAGSRSALLFSHPIGASLPRLIWHR